MSAEQISLGQRHAVPPTNGYFNTDTEMTEPDFNDFTVNPVAGKIQMDDVHFDPDAAAFEPETDDSRRSTAQKRVQHQVAFVRRGQQAAFDQRHGLFYSQNF
jgi:hypothetical protein